MAQTIQFNVTGMTCDHCVNAVTRAVKDVPGVSGVKVSLDEKCAEVTGDIVDVAAVVAAIAEEGYTATARS